ncbi:MAG: hypothetical protein COA79_10620 [Planctomycetota bacterium]|nr:MAG: hypothetical protein COA79_10620 [Planctomycetota bacterium]
MTKRSSDSSSTSDLSDRIYLPSEFNALSRCIEKVNNCFDAHLLELNTKIINDELKKEQIGQLKNFLKNYRVL